MNILLLDVDSKIPNIALMKLSQHYKNLGNEIFLKIINIPFFPNKKKEEYIVPGGFDKVYCSVIFDNNIQYVNFKNYNKSQIEIGGTGYSLEKKLPEHIENLSPDYSLYPDNETSYGFISRGCIRNCYFCKVPKKEGKIKQVDTVKNIAKHKFVEFLDNNILALPNHKEILKEIIDLKIRCSFKQGLDIRLLDKENSELLSKIKYTTEYIFAFDDIKYKKMIQDKLLLLNWAKNWKLKFYVYVNPNMPLKDTIDRVEFLRENKCLPYIMRDISCWSSILNNFLIDYAAYCNQVFMFKNLSFEEFLLKKWSRGKKFNKKRYDESIMFYEKGKRGE